MSRRFVTALTGWLIVTGMALGQAGVATDAAQSSPHPESLPVPQTDAPGPGHWVPDHPLPAVPHATNTGVSVRWSYLYWWIRDGRVPQPLVTTGTTDSQGILGNSGTQVIFGAGKNFEYNAFNGTRILAESALGSTCIDLQVGGFLLEQRTDYFTAASDATGSPVLARPFFNAQTLAETSRLIGFPDAFAGTVSISSASQMWGAEANFARQVASGCDWSIRLLGGFRYINLDEDMRVFDNIRLLDSGIAGFLGTPIFDGALVSSFDAFDTRNQFYGGQIGAEARIRRGFWLVDLSAKIAFGATRQTVSITGGTAVGDAQANGVASGGLLAVASNIGRTTDDDFSVVPELGINVGICLSNNLVVRVGYTFLYWTDVVRPGEQVNRQVNTSQVPSSLLFGAAGGDIQPIAPFATSDFWAQGLHGSIELRY